MALPTDDGSTATIEPGVWTVVYFYPKDDTPGCTVEACDFRDQHARIVEAGARVIGVSPDPAARHGKFRAKYDLPFALASDTDKTTVQAWGAWGEKSFMGRKSQGVLRSTYLVAPDGTIAAAWPKVTVKGHVQAVVETLQRLRGG